MKWLVTYPEDGPSVAFYLNWLKAGEVDASLLPAHYPHPGSIAGFDALLLPGGGDVDPGQYGVSEHHPKTGGISAPRDRLEIALIAEFIEARKPVFGICRGIQILNVALGGRLVQHVPDFLGPASAEAHSRKDSYDSRHPLTVDASTRLGMALSGAREVNSSHHQAIDPAFVGKGLRIAARSGAGLIEAVECFDHAAPLVAVQWHPEREPDADAPSTKNLRQFFKSLV